MQISRARFAFAVLLIVGSLAAQERPGRINSETVVLPNRWKLSPAGKSVALGDFPLNMAMSPDGRYMAVVHNGQGRQFVAVVDLQTQARISEVTIDKGFWGICFTPDGKTLLVSGAGDNWIYSYAFKAGFLSDETRIVLGGPNDKIYPAGIAVSADGKTLFTANNLANSVSIVSLKTSTVSKTVSFEKDSYPYAVQVGKDDSQIYVSLWGKSSVAIVDLKSGTVAGQIPVGDHPNAMELAADGKTLFVANANSNTVSVIDLATRKAVVAVSTALHPNSLEGSTPNALAVSRDGKVLIVANADNNDVALVDITKPADARVRGFIPVGWYPTAVRFSADDKRIYVANGKGTTSFANPQGPTPYTGSAEPVQYIARLMQGSMSVIDLPSDAQLSAYSKKVYDNSPYLANDQVTMTSGGPNAIPAKVGDPSPIKHVIYIIKENRTYDQIFGDVKQGNGDAHLCLFPEKITPNHHALAQEYVLLDNFYVDAEVSADGHNWSMGAYATDYVEKMWPQNYSKRKRDYDFEGESAVAAPSIGYIWDQAKRKGVSYRSYGEFVTNAKSAKDPGKATIPALAGHFDPMYRSFDTDYRDVDRANRFIGELKGFEQGADLPQLTIVRLPNDHTAATKPGALTPVAMVADNDLALGMIVEAVSKSRFWKDTALFVVEDDAQNGPDHVDAHRTVALVISPYTKHRVVDSTFYSTASMLRTMELILGLSPMSQFDAAALPMYNAFTADASPATYTHRTPETNLNEVNTATSYGAQRSARMNFKKEDAVPDLLFSEIIWRAVRGAGSVMPSPVHAAFVRPLKESSKDLDDKK